MYRRESGGTGILGVGGKECVLTELKQLVTSTGRVVDLGIFYEKLPRHKALKCHSKCRLELNTLQNFNLLSPDAFPSILKAFPPD